MNSWSQKEIEELERLGDQARAEATGPKSAPGAFGYLYMALENALLCDLPEVLAAMPAGRVRQHLHEAGEHLKATLHSLDEAYEASLAPLLEDRP